MSFDDISGAATVRVSKDAFTPLGKQINDGFNKEEHELELSRIADTALAVGVVENERAETESPTNTLNLGSIDKYGVMKAIIEERHPDVESDDLREVLQEYLEGGAILIAEEIDEKGVFNYHSYLSNGE